MCNPYPIVCAEKGPKSCHRSRFTGHAKVSSVRSDKGVGRAIRYTSTSEQKSLQVQFLIIIPEDHSWGGRKSASKAKMPLLLVFWGRKSAKNTFAKSQLGRSAARESAF